MMKHLSEFNNKEIIKLVLYDFDGVFTDNNVIVDEKGHESVFCSRYEAGGGSEDDTILTYIGNKFFTGLCNLLFKLKITDVLFTYVMGSTKAFKELNMSFNDFSFCVELPIKAKKKNYILGNLPSVERSRKAGIKKVNEFRDGFLILMSIIKLLIFKK